MDLFLESVRAIVIGSVIVFLLVKPISSGILKVEGWGFIITGFCTLFFGTLIDITDNFESLNTYLFIGDTAIQAVLEKIVGYLFGFLFLAYGFWRWLPKVIELEKQKKDDLNKAVEEIKVLSGLLPICSTCKKIRSDDGYWSQIESYIAARSEAEFSHGICPECQEKLYPEWYR
jgi:hypothetical protein